MAGVAETSAISRPSGTWTMPGARPATAAVPATTTPPTASAPTAEGERPPAEAASDAAPVDDASAAAPGEPAADNLANPYPSPVAESAPEEAVAEPSPAPATAGPFDRGAASVALATATATAAGCRVGDAPTGTTRVAVTFAPSGRVTQATVSGAPYAGTPTGGCIAQAFRGVSISPFQGDPVTVTKSVSIR